MPRFQVYQDGRATGEIIEGDPHEHIKRLNKDTDQEHVAVYLEAWAAPAPGVEYRQSADGITRLTGVPTRVTKITAPAEPSAPEKRGLLARMFKAKDSG